MMREGFVNRDFCLAGFCTPRSEADPTGYDPQPTWNPASCFFLAWEVKDLRTVCFLGPWDHSQALQMIVMLVRGK